MKHAAICFAAILAAVAGTAGTASAQSAPVASSRTVPAQIQNSSDAALDERLPRCLSCCTPLKPDVVLYGEAVSQFEAALLKVLDADVLLVLGSSLEVGPINLLPLEAHQHGIDCALINLDPTRLDRCFDLVFRAPIGQTAQALQARLESRA